MGIKGKQIISLQSQKKSMVIIFDDFTDIIIGKDVTGFHSE